MSEQSSHSNIPLVEKVSKCWSILKAFWKDVEIVTTHTRNIKWQMLGAHLERDRWSRTERLAVLDEEIGKLHRCANKLKITQDERIKEQWLSEGYYRILTSASMLRRIAEHWRDM